MKRSFTSFILQLSITLLLFSLAFYAFTQTTIFNMLLNEMHRVISVTPLFVGLESVIPWFMVFFVYFLVLLVGIFGGKGGLSLVYYVSILLFFPSALSFSEINWLEVVGFTMRLESFLSFQLVCQV